MNPKDRAVTPGVSRTTFDRSGSKGLSTLNQSVQSRFDDGEAIDEFQTDTIDVCILSAIGSLSPLIYSRGIGLQEKYHI